jgi:hypothetical protein
MFRKILIATVASLSFLSPLALPTESQAREVHRAYRGHAVHRVYRAHSDYRVYYRGGNGNAWLNGATYRSRADAFRAASNYRGRGFEAYVR